MPRTSVTTQDLTVAGVDLTFQTPDALGDIVDVGANLVLLVKNDSGGAITATLQTPGQVHGIDVAENAHSVPAGTISAFRLDNGVYGRTTGSDVGRAYVDYSGVTSVSTAVVRVR